MDVSQCSLGTDNFNSCANLQTILGNMGVHDGEVNYIRGLLNVQRAYD